MRPIRGGYLSFYNRNQSGLPLLPYPFPNETDSLLRNGCSSFYRYGFGNPPELPFCL